MISNEGGGQSDQDGIRKAGGEHILVGTRSGSYYLIDLHAMRLKRMPASGDEVLSHDDGQPMSQPLRRDQEWLKIIHLGRLTLGERLEIHLEPLGDPRVVAFTQRLTTEVVSITVLEPPAEAASESGGP